MQIYLRVIRYARAYRKHIASSILCTVLYSVFSGVSIYLFIPLLDLLFHPDKAEAQGAASQTLTVPFGLGSLVSSVKEGFIAFVFGGGQMDALFKICMILIGAFFLKNLFGYLQSFFMNYAEEGVIKDLRDALYRHLHDLPLGYFTNERTGRLISRITNDVTVINGGISAFFVTLVREPLLSGGAAGRRAPADATAPAATRVDAAGTRPRPPRPRPSRASATVARVASPGVVGAPASPPASAPSPRRAPRGVRAPLSRASRPVS